MNRIRLRISAGLRSPFLFPGLAAGSGGLDAVALRDHRGRPIIPQDQIRGVLRHALLDVVRAGGRVASTDLDTLFGEASRDAHNDGEDAAAPAHFAPARGRILFGDLVAISQGATTRAVRVRIDPETGAADPGGLLFVELIAAYGQEVAFEGEAILFATDAQSEPWIEALQASTSWVSAMGAMKSAGFGEIVTLSIAEAGRHRLVPTSVSGHVADRRGYRMATDRPFLVDARRAADNVYVGSDIIPGGAIKGLLAQKLRLMGRDPEADPALSALRISHARPEGASCPLPLSLVVGVDGTIGDALDVPLDRGAVIGGQPARFMTDWKSGDEASVRKTLATPDHAPLLRSVRVHVAIDQGTGTAEDQKLFVTNSVEPGERRWHVDVDFSGIADPDDRARLAAAIETGLDGLGRTGASITFQPAEASTQPAVKPVAGETVKFAVVLLTDTVMVSPEDAPDAVDAYRAYWSRVCPGSTLENFYARQRLAGGYISRRYQVRDGYTPFWLTEAGSVFLLSGAAIPDRLSELVRDGLPAPVIGGSATDWRQCPYQPENGYGAIRADYDAALTAGVGHG